MQTTIQLTREDWKALRRAVGKSRWWFWSGLLAFAALIVLRDTFEHHFSLRVVDGLAPVTVSAEITNIAIVACSWSLAWAAMGYYLQSKALRAPMFRAPSVMRADENGFSRVTLDNSKTIGWPKVYKLTETATHFFVLTSSRTAFIVPKRAFANAAEAAQFIEYVRGQTADAQANKPPIARP